MIHFICETNGKVEGTKNSSKNKKKQLHFILIKCQFLSISFELFD